MAFCHWLSARSGLEVRLPTEFEWQCAAIGADPGQGEPRRVYPWGRDWDPKRQPWRANTIESELNHSTAVGLYPLGAARVTASAASVFGCCVRPPSSISEH